MTWRDFPLPSGSYDDVTKPWSSQDVVNFLPTFAAEAGPRSPVKYQPVPGLYPFGYVGDGPHRGAHNCEGKRFVVSGRKLYQVSKLGVSTELGTIPGTGRVTMAHNQIDNGNEVIIATGDNSYVWNTVTETLTATGIPLLWVDFINQRFVGVDRARRFWRHSDLADGLSWSDLDVFSSESSPDRITGLKVVDGQVVVFNERTTEVFVNEPTATAAFQRSVVIQRGCLAGDTVTLLGGALFFVGDDYAPYRLDGYTPTPIGPKPIVAELSQHEARKLFGLGWEDRGYLVYYVTAQDGVTWGYDITSQRWHRRESYGLDRWRVNTLFKADGDWYAGDYTHGGLYRLTWGYMRENADPMPRRIRTGVLHNAGNRVRVDAIRLFVETGGKAIAPPTPSITGNVPDGYAGDAISGAYTVTGGAPPYSDITVLSGTFPTGLTLNADGTYTGSLTTAGSYSWTVGGTDSAGQAFSVADTSEVNSASTLYDQVTYTGDGTASRSIATTVDLSGGGLVVISRATYGFMGLYSTTGAVCKKIQINSFTGASEGTANTFGTGVFSLVNEHDGAVTTAHRLNASGVVYTAHVFKKAARFFDIVEYTGTAASNTVPHALGVEPGMVVLQRTISASPSYVTHIRSLGVGKGFALTETSAPATDASRRPFSSLPTSASMTLSAAAFQNQSGGSYFAFLWADDSSANGIIRNVTWTGSGASGNQVTTAGWQPQMVMGRADANSSVFRFIGDEYNANFVGNDQQCLPDGTTDTTTDVVGLVSGGFQLNSATLNASTVVHHAMVIRKP